MEDLIRRQDAIDALVETEDIKGLAYKQLEDRLQKIPAVAIERDCDRCFGACFGDCSECDEINESGKSNFCPNCGAQMFAKDINAPNNKDRTMISPKEFADKMKRIAEKKTNEEMCHIEMDDYMCDVLRQLGFEEGVAIFMDTPKWYS